MHPFKPLVGFVFLAVLSLALIHQSQATPLDDYVHAPDSHFGWTVIRTYQQPDYALYILNFTSQKWMDGKLIDQWCCESTINHDDHFVTQKRFPAVQSGGIIYALLFQINWHDRTLPSCWLMAVVITMGRMEPSAWMVAEHFLIAECPNHKIISLV